jgi:hypothetical protein
MTTPTRTKRPSRASQAAGRAAADEPANVTPITAHGRSSTGDNGGGRQPKAQPAKAAATPKPKATPKAKSEPKPATATAGVKPFDRYRATAKKGRETVTEPGSPNGHLSRQSAQAVADRLAKAAGDGWQPEVATFDRFQATVQPLAEGAELLVCTCRYGHRSQDAALPCSAKLAKTNGLRI